MSQHISWSSGSGSISDAGSESGFVFGVATTASFSSSSGIWKVCINSRNDTFGCEGMVREESSCLSNSIIEDDPASPTSNSFSVCRLHGSTHVVVACGAGGGKGGGGGRGGQGCADNA